MNQVSVNYLNDPEEGLDDDTIAHIDNEYFYRLPHLKVRNPKLLVVFSGGNAMGKTTLSNKIRDELSGLMLENDAIKFVIQTLWPHLDKKERNLYTWQYCQGLYRRLGDLTPNGLVIRDGVIDWYYDRILPIFKDRGFEIFTIGFAVSAERNRELILGREEKATVTNEMLLSRIDEHKTHNARFRAEYPVDVLLTDDNLFDHDMVVDQIRKQLKILA